MLKQMLLALALTGTATGVVIAATPDDCPADPPVRRVESVKIYTDSHGAVADMDRVRERNRLLQPVRSFLADASSRADSAEPSERRCALMLLQSWAAAGALEQQPEDIAAAHDLETFSIALDVIALKLQASGLPVDSLLAWLGALERSSVGYFDNRFRTATAARRPDAGWAPVDNLYVWSGVAAASYAVLSGDAGARRTGDRIWSQGIAQIRPDGYLEAELRRGGKALAYHAYALSALLTLARFRGALGDTLTATDRDALLRLVGATGAGFCDPAAIAAAAGGFDQEKAVPAQVSTGFMLMPQFVTDQVQRCLGAAPPNDPQFGGSVERTATILSGLHGPR